MRTTTATRDATGRGPLLDVDGVARALGITPRHVRRLVAERRIPFFKVGRFVRFDPGELDLWLEQQRVEVHRSPSFSHRRAIASLMYQVAWSPTMHVGSPSAFASVDATCLQGE